MKKILSALMIVACLFMAMPAQAQFQFGLKGGLNISKLTFSEDIVKEIIVPDSLLVRWLSLQFLL